MPTSHSSSKQLCSRENPALISISERILLTKPESTKKTFHLSLDIRNTTLQFKPGDALAVYPQNDPIIAHKIVQLLQQDSNQEVYYARIGKTLPLYELLVKEANIARLTSNTLKLFLEYAQSAKERQQLEDLLQSKELLQHYLTRNDLIDFLKVYDAKNVPIEKFCQQLSPLLPRFYSIASSQLINSNYLDLTVVLVQFKKNDRLQYGVGSHFLCNLAKVKETVFAAYIQPSTDFTIPEDPSASIIMVGPGTGVAPFRGFLQERLIKEHKGKNWLFFGERNRKYDFFYQDLWENLVAAENLRLDLAFSRDQKDKIYVQHKLFAQAHEIWHWLEKGAYFYLCGSAKQMAKDVEKTMEEIICSQGGLSKEDACNYLKNLRKQKRYVKEVY